MESLKLGVAVLLLLLWGCWTTQALPTMSVASDTTEKPRCLSSLFGGLFEPVVDVPQLPDFPSPYQGSGVGNLQGGAFSSPGGLGFGGVTSPGLGVPSHFTPGLGQASQVYKQSQGLENQLYGTQSQINAQLAGVPGSGIPLSPGYLRNVGGSLGTASEVTYLPPPPSFYYG